METLKRGNAIQMRTDRRPSFLRCIPGYISDDYQWLFIAFLRIITIILGCRGFSLYLRTQGEEDNLLRELCLT